MSNKYSSDKGMQNLFEGFRRSLYEMQKMHNPKHALEAAIFYTLRDYNASEQNPVPLSAIFDSSSGAVLRYLKEQGLDDDGIRRAMAGAGRYTRGESEIAVPGGLDPSMPSYLAKTGEFVKLKLATVQVGPSKGEQGMYMVDLRTGD